jgi:hypothetical protein
MRGVCAAAAIGVMLCFPAAAGAAEPCGPERDYAQHGVWSEGGGVYRVGLPDLPGYKIAVFGEPHRHRSGRIHGHYRVGLLQLSPRGRAEANMTLTDPQLSISGATTYFGPGPHSFAWVLGIRINTSGANRVTATWDEIRNYTFDLDRSPRTTADWESREEACTRTAHLDVSALTCRTHRHRSGRRHPHCGLEMARR